MRASRRLIVDLPEPLFAALAEVAEQNGRSLHEEFRIRLRKSLPEEMRGAKRSGRTDERLLAPLRARVAGAIGQAVGWEDLQRRMGALGYVFRERGGGLALHRLSDGERLCKGSEIGAAYADLMRRFRAPFPGHAHRHLVARVLGDDPVARFAPVTPAAPVASPLQRRSPAPRPRQPSFWDDDDPGLIEPD